MLSPNFSLEELTRSQTAVRHGIDNTPSDEQLDNLTRLCMTVLQPLRTALGAPIMVTSGLRIKALNEMIGGSSDSDHLYGCAADIVAVGFSPLQVARILEGHLEDWPIRQVIHEFGRWVHVSTTRKREEEPRRELLTATRFDGQTRYVEGLLTDTGAQDALRMKG